MKNKQIPVGLARPDHLVGLSVDDWVAQGCSVWGLGWSHNCFLWAAQPPEPLHNWLSGWYSPPPSFPHIPLTPTPSSPLFLRPSSPLQYSLLQALLPPFSSLPVSQSIHSHSFSLWLNTSSVALSGWSRLNKFLNFCVRHLNENVSHLSVYLALSACFFSTYLLWWHCLKWSHVGAWAQCTFTITSSC